MFALYFNVNDYFNVLFLSPLYCSRGPAGLSGFCRVVVISGVCSLQPPTRLPPPKLQKHSKTLFISSAGNEERPDPQPLTVSAAKVNLPAGSHRSPAEPTCVRSASGVK